jgi:hypothetical protein
MNKMLGSPAEGGAAPYGEAVELFRRASGEFKPKHRSHDHPLDGVDAAKERFGRAATEASVTDSRCLVME